MATRLPTGYRAEVLKVKSYLEELLIELSNTSLNLESKLSILRSVPKLEITNIYKHEKFKDITLIDFDLNIIGGQIKLNTKTGLLELTSKCTVFIEGTDEFIDNYKW